MLETRLLGQPTLTLCVVNACKELQATLRLTRKVQNSVHGGRVLMNY